MLPSKSMVTLLRTAAVGFISWSLVVPSSTATPVCPYPVIVQQNGTEIELYLHGTNPENVYWTDADGYTVLMDELDPSIVDGGRNAAQFVYATRNDTNGVLISSGMVVGYGDPSDIGIPRRLQPFKVNEYQRRRNRYEEIVFPDQKHDTQHPTTERRRLTVGPVMKNLVILVRFADHMKRTLPPRYAYHVLFNGDVNGSPTHPWAPTGTVKDVFSINSYGKFDLQSTVYGWVTLPENEAYYANGVSGFGRNSLFYEAARYALDAAQRNYGINFEAFDANNDGRVDCFTLIHSGFAGEMWGTDQDGTYYTDRIWSHRWSLGSSRRWISDSGVAVTQYNTVNGLFGLEGSSIGRIGVVAHEIGHVIGLPDLYGTLAGNGIGNYDFMANHWSFAPYEDRQLYPPIMSPWSKIRAGWLDPILITVSGKYFASPSALTEQVYKIDLNLEGTEYLLIENRQPVTFDVFLPIDPHDPDRRRGGLAIWHIDEGASGMEGYPGQDALWPFNGKHYEVSLLQADGRYDLERGNNFGDSGDLFHGNGHGVNFLRQSDNLLDGPFPNTDAYRDGLVRQTGIRIRDIGSSAPIMSFTVDFLQMIATTFRGGNGAGGNMFDMVVKKDITLRAFSVHMAASGSQILEVWYKRGSYRSFERDPLAWNRLRLLTIVSNGRGRKTRADVGGVSLRTGTHSFYIFSLDARVRYTNGNGSGSIVADNEDIRVLEGVGTGTPFGSVYQDRIWNGELFYEVN